MTNVLFYDQCIIHIHIKLYLQQYIDLPCRNNKWNEMILKFSHVLTPFCHWHGIALVPFCQRHDDMFFYVVAIAIAWALYIYVLFLADWIENIQEQDIWAPCGPHVCCSGQTMNIHVVCKLDQKKKMKNEMFCGIKLIILMCIYENITQIL